MHPEFEVQVTVIMVPDDELVVPELLPVVPLELPLPPPLELLPLLLPGLELLHPNRATAATDAITLNARTIFIGFSSQTQRFGLSPRRLGKQVPTTRQIRREIAGPRARATRDASEREREETRKDGKESRFFPLRQAA
jgi:hypothetical protein